MSCYFLLSCFFFFFSRDSLLRFRLYFCVDRRESKERLRGMDTCVVTTLKSFSDVPSIRLFPVPLRIFLLSYSLNLMLASSIVRESRMSVFRDETIRQLSISPVHTDRRRWDVCSANRLGLSMKITINALIYAPTSVPFLLLHTQPDMRFRTRTVGGGWRGTTVVDCRSFWQSKNWVMLSIS